jgi:hypothetical protein
MLTVLFSVSFGIYGAYALISGILLAFGRNSRSKTETAPALVTAAERQSATAGS